MQRKRWQLQGWSIIPGLHLPAGQQSRPITTVALALGRPCWRDIRLWVGIHLRRCPPCKSWGRRQAAMAAQAAVMDARWVCLRLLSSILLRLGWCMLLMLWRVQLLVLAVEGICNPYCVGGQLRHGTGGHGATDSHRGHGHAEGDWHWLGGLWADWVSLHEGPERRLQVLGSRQPQSAARWH